MGLDTKGMQTDNYGVMERGSLFSLGEIDLGA